MRISTKTATGGNLTTPADLAARWHFKAQTINGAAEYHSAHHTGNGTTKDGFLLDDDGTAWMARPGIA